MMAGEVTQQPTTTTTNPYNEALRLNSSLVEVLMERLLVHIGATPRSDPVGFSTLCISLARGIDYAVAHNEIPPRAPDLPLLLKQVYQRKSEYSLQAAIMVLMISVKSACASGWFMDKDAGDLLKLTNELGSIFHDTENIHPEPSNSLPIISNIMARFYPRMKMGSVLVSLEIKPGYGVYVTDFTITKRMVNAEEKIHLFVARKDSTEASSCIINPPLVNFLLNGKGVDRRNNLQVDNGPQFPTNLTSMLRYGTNLLQAIGPFDGNYIVAIVFMSVTSSLEAPVLQDYIRPLVAAHNSDSDIIEGSSRISLNCPISLTRIKTPAKGHLCKHHQCFDHDNFIEMNLRRPSWRCPQCDQSLSYIDIRIDQFMAKILREVGESAAEVIISADGSWKQVMESGVSTESLGCQQDFSKQSDCSSAAANIVDLTMEDMDDNDVRDTWDMVDRKPSLDILQGSSITTNTTLPSEVNNTSQGVQGAASQMEEDIWARILSCSASFGMTSGISETPARSTISSAPTDIVALALDQVSGVTHGPTQLSSTSMRQDQLLEPRSSQCLPSVLESSLVYSDSAIRLSHMRNVTRTPVAVQALPAQTPNSHQWSSTNINSLMANASPLASQTPISIQGLPAQTIPNSHQWSSASFGSPLPSFGPPVASQTPPCATPIADGSSTRFAPPAFDTVSTSLQRHMLTQNRDYQNYNYPRVPSQSSQQVIGLPAPTQNLHHQQAPNFWVPQSTTQPPSTVGLSTHFPNLQQAQHQRVSQSTASPPGLVRPSSHFPHHQQAPHLRVPLSTRAPPCMVGPSTSSPQISVPSGLQGSISHMSGSHTNMHSRFSVAAPRASNMTRAPPVTPVHLQPARPGSNFSMTTDDISRKSMGAQQRGGNIGGMARPVSRTQDLIGSGRMRGGLSEEATLTGPFSHHVIRPTQQAQVAKSPPALTSQVVTNSSLPMRNSLNTETSQQSFPVTGDVAGRSGSTGIVP